MPDEEERTYECETCGHVYTGGYGRWFDTAGGSRWLCLECICARQHRPTNQGATR